MLSISLLARCLWIKIMTTVHLLSGCVVVFETGSVLVRVFVCFSFVKLTISLGLLGKGNFHLENASMQFACKYDIFFTNDWWGWGSSLWLVPPLNSRPWVCLKNKQTKNKLSKSCGKKSQTNQYCSSVVSASIPASWFLSWVPALTFLNDALQYGHVRQMHNFSLRLLLVVLSLSQQQNVN